MKKKKTKKIKISRLHFVLILIFYFILGGTTWAAIRMTDDPKPKKIVYKIKDVSTGCISTKYAVPDEDDFEYNIGDLFEEAGTAYPNGTITFSMMHKYVVIAKKNYKWNISQ